jgi:transmembrane sensor
VASWRDDVLVADGLSFAQIAEILDRRIPGRVILTDDALGQQTIVGHFDLSDAQGTLDLLAELTGAKVTSVPNLAYFVRR